MREGALEDSQLMPRMPEHRDLGDGKDARHRRTVVMYDPVAVRIYRLNDVVEQVIGILEGYVWSLSALKASDVGDWPSLR